MPTLQPGIYRHFKGNLYRVWGIVQHSETQEPLVLYQALYGACGLWVRPLAMFTEQVTRAGITRPRFAYEGPVLQEDIALTAALAHSFSTIR